MTSPQPDMTVNLGGLRLGSPLVLLSGCVGFGLELKNLAGWDQTAIGAIILKGTTLEPRLGNPTPRVVSTPSGMLNAIGLHNPGAREVAGRLVPQARALLTPCLLANIAGSTVEEYAEVARIFDDSPVDGIEINISCPNIKEGGAAFGADPLTAARVVAAVRRATRKPLITKLSPNVTDIRPIARAVMEEGSDALSAINTLMGMAINTVTRRPELGNVQGGLSGPAIKPVALLKVWQVYQEARPRGIPILGQGGVGDTEDVIAFLLAGSTAVGLGTVLFRNPWIATKIIAGLAAYLQTQQCRHLAELTGALSLPAPPTKPPE